MENGDQSDRKEGRVSRGTLVWGAACVVGGWLASEALFRIGFWDLIPWTVKVAFFVLDLALVVGAFRDVLGGAERTFYHRHPIVAALAVGLVLLVVPDFVRQVVRTNAPAPTSSDSSASSTSQPCTRATGSVSWIGDGDDGVPSNGHDYVYVIPACSTALFDGGRFQLDDGTGCDGFGIQLCVIVWGVTDDTTGTLHGLDTGANFFGVTSSDYQDALSNKSPKWWVYPNCQPQLGCVGALVTVYVDGHQVRKNDLVPRS
jgi:hypothetical protein